MDRTIRVLVLSGDAAGVFDVRSRLGRLSVRDVAWIGDASNAIEVESARAAVLRSGNAGVALIIVDARSVLARPMPMSGAMFGRARVEVLRSIESLLPVEPEGAAVSFVDRAGSGGSVPPGEGAGYLLCVGASDLKRAQELGAAVLGGHAGLVLTPHQVVGAIGSGHERLVVRETGDFGDAQDTIISGEGIIELRSDADRSSGADLVLPHDGSESSAASSRRLAIASAVGYLRASLGPALIGRTPAAWRPFVPAAAMVLIALGLLWAAGLIRADRYDAAIESLRAEQRALGPALTRVTASRAESDQLEARLALVERTAIDGRSRALGALDAVERALPESAFLDQLVVDSEGVRLRGYASSARDVLTALESSEALTGAREIQRPQPVGDGSGREFFEIRVQFQRSSTGGDQ